MQEAKKEQDGRRETNMQVIWAPWRMGYVSQERKGGCFLCRKAAEAEDAKNFILARWEKCFALLNTFPYNNGHLLIAPYRHVGEYEELEEAEVLGIGEGLKRVLRAEKAVLRPDGFNVGLNLGEAAGAGAPEHLHVHVVPRWSADTNFMPVLAATKVIPQHLEETWKALRQALAG
jgi:ATP adenylyltransferase